ncbi:MAG TPA: glycosyltransferase family 4 protein [Candidatus Didemnitutus sp.]|jgi:glycosyltransferase involved in cell wall biosynthesis
MSETPFSFCQLESGEIQPLAGSQTLRGWVWPKQGAPFVDVRARAGSRVFPGILGLPRADLAAHFQTGRPFALAGFEVMVFLLPGSTELSLDVLDLDGTWRCVRTQELIVAGGVHGPSPRSIEPIRWIEYCHGLDLLLRWIAGEPPSAWREIAGRLAREMPHPRMLHHAPPPLVGFVDEPAAVTCSRFGRIPAFGHLFHPAQRIRRILGSVDLQAWQPIPHELPSPGPAAFYAGMANAASCGFAGFIDVPAQIPNPLALRLYAELDDGAVHLSHVVRARAHTEAEEKKPVCAWQPQTFDHLMAAWDGALAEHGLEVIRDVEWAHQVAFTRVRFDTAGRPRAPEIPEMPCRATTPGLPRRIVLATHGLGLQGAPGFLFDLARTYVERGARVQVVSAEEGPLRARFAALGAEVAIVDTAAVHAASSPAAVTAALAELRSRISWREADLVVANSFTTFWAVHAAKAEGCPVLLYIHESTTPAVFFGTRVPADVIRLAENAFATADIVSFTSTASRVCHQGYGAPDRYRLTPPWIDIEALDRHRASDAAARLREHLKVAPGGRLVCNIGTVSDRKGQHTFARAVDLLHRRRPDLAGRTQFVMLGGRNTVFDRMLGDLLTELALPNLRVEPETADYVPYYLGADIFACSSYEESSPRVVLEAMACGSPIVASAVHGIPELVGPDREALLVPAGDTHAWCDGLIRMLDDPAWARDLARAARDRVVAEFSASAVLPRHWNLACAVAQGQSSPG